MPPGGRAPIDLVSPRVGAMTAGLVEMRSPTMEALVLGAGLGLYIAGLFAPLGGRRRRISGE
jgi:hypothetical protein